MIACNTLDDYLSKYGELLGKQAQDLLNPLHVPGRDPVLDFKKYLRKPLPAQGQVITGAVKGLRQQNAVFVVGEQGSGKTLMASVTFHELARGRPYRALVFCPPQLVDKWKREILDTIPKACVTVIGHSKQLARMGRKSRPARAEWFVIGRDKCKLDSDWKGAAWDRTYGLKHEGKDSPVRCPGCGGRIMDKTGNISLSLADLKRRKRKCTLLKPRAGDGKLVPCGEMLWSKYGRQNGGLDRFSPAIYIHKRMKGFFDYLVIDEAHEERSDSSIQGEAMGSLLAACRKALLLTGTILGGYAHHIRALVLRAAPQSLLEEGLHWNNPTKFNRRYGCMETIVTETSKETASSHRYGRGTKSVTKFAKAKPGIMPQLFGRHLLGKACYLGLDQISNSLPRFREFVRPEPDENDFFGGAVDMDEEVAEEYARIEKRLREANADLIRNNDRRLLAAMLQCLLAYPDYPYDWETIGYHDTYQDPETGEIKKRFIPVVQPKNLSPAIVRPKERRLIDICRREVAAGRQTWVFVQYTKKRPVLYRLEKVLMEAGFKVKVLDADDVPAEKREAWIEKNAPGIDVMISHPKPVQTGLDLFSKKGTHNFPTIVFYETGYDTFVLRQASRRAWRIGQKVACKVYYNYYESTAQAAAMTLMGKKIQAALALDGKFSVDGLVAMSGDEASMQMALAKALDEYMPGDATKNWGAVADFSGGEDFVTEPVAEPEPVAKPKKAKRTVGLSQAKRIQAQHYHNGSPENRGIGDAAADETSVVPPKPTDDDDDWMMLSPQIKRPVKKVSARQAILALLLKSA